MQVDVNKAMKNDLKKLTSSDPAENSTLAMVTAIKKAGAKFNVNVVGVYLNTEDGSQNPKADLFSPVLVADDQHNYSVDLQYPGEPVSKDQDGDLTTNEQSNVGVLVNTMRHQLEVGGPLAAVAVMYDEGASQQLVLANMYNTWPELREAVDKLIRQELSGIFVAETKANPQPSEG